MHEPQYCCATTSRTNVISLESGSCKSRVTVGACEDIDSCCKSRNRKRCWLLCPSKSSLNENETKEEVIRVLSPYIETLVYAVLGIMVCCRLQTLYNCLTIIACICNLSMQRQKLGQPCFCTLPQCSSYMFTGSFYV